MVHVFLPRCGAYSRRDWLPVTAGIRHGGGLVNYTRLDDSAEKIIHTQGIQCVRTMKCGLPMLKEIHYPRRSWTPDDARSVHLPWLLQSPQHNASAFDANGFYCSGDLSLLIQRGTSPCRGARKIRSTWRREDRCRRDRKPAAAPSGVIYAALVSMEDELMGEKSCAIWW